MPTTSSPLAPGYDLDPNRIPAPRIPGLVELLDRVERAVAAALTPATSSAGVSRDGWRVLLMLARGGGRSMGDIAAHTGLPAPTATRVVDRLVAQRLAHRQGDPVDRRRVLVHLAAQGREVVDRVCGSIERRVGTALGAVDPGERIRLARLLDGLATSDGPVPHAAAGASERTPH